MIATQMKPQTEMSDEQILALLAAPSTHERGFRLLVQRYQEPLYRHIRRLVLRHDDTDDVLQNTFIKVFKNVARFEGKSKLFTWLYRIATNEAISFLQSQQRHETDTLDQPEMNGSRQLRADAYLEGSEIEQKLQKVLLLLPEKQRVVFNLRYFEEMPYEQMSEVLETSVGALKASYHHAVKKVEAFFINN